MGQADNDSSSIHQQMARWVMLLDQWEHALSSGKKVIVLGDVNLDPLKFQDSGQLQPMIDKMFEEIYPHGVYQCVQGPTHSWPGCADSGLDHIYTNCPEKLSKPEAQFRGASDHRLIFATKYCKNIRQQIRYCRKRSYKDFKEHEFLAEVRKVNWWDVYSSSEVDLAVHLFTTKLTNILDRLAPIKKFQIRTKYAAWISVETKKKIKLRDDSQEKAATTRSLEDWSDYKKKRNEVTSLLYKEKQSWQRKKLDNCEESQDTGKLWKNLLGWLNWSSTSSPTKLLSEGRFVTSPAKLADVQNEYYIKKVRNIRQNLPQACTDPLSTLKLSMQGKDATTFSLTAVSPKEVEKIISNLKNSKASGIDELDTYILKLIKKEIVPAVCHILNLSIQSKNFPTKWKMQKWFLYTRAKAANLKVKLQTSCYTASFEQSFEESIFR